MGFFWIGVSNMVFIGFIGFNLLGLLCLQGFKQFFGLKDFIGIKGFIGILGPIFFPVL